VWDGTSYYGASLKALESLASQKGCDLVGCLLSVINAFFVKRDLVENKCCAPFTSENHFEPPRFGFYKIGAYDMHLCILLPKGVINFISAYQSIRFGFPSARAPHNSASLLSQRSSSPVARPHP
jgi:hypothetical protein